MARYQLIAGPAAPERMNRTYASARRGDRPDFTSVRTKSLPPQPLVSDASGTQGSWKKSMYPDRSAWVLEIIDFAIAAGWGVASEVTVSSRSGCHAAALHATAPPQSWPTTWKRSTPAASASAIRSPTRRPMA